jgi:hypothetical protein
MNSDNEMVKIPLPLEIPQPPSIENLPLDILHSATVEMLIQQNDDLTSRLKVNIRRNSQLEQRILELENDAKNLSRDQQKMLSKYEIVCEKEKIWSEQKESKSRQTESLEKEIELLNLRYNELYTTSQRIQKNIQKDLVEKNSFNQILKDKIQILFNIKSRSKEKLRYFLLEMAEKFQQLENELKKAQATNRLFSTKFDSLQQEITNKEIVFKEQFENFKELSQKNNESLQSKNEGLQEQLKTLNNQTQEYKFELKKLSDELTHEKKSRVKLKQMSEEINLLRNEKVKLRSEFDKKMQNTDLNSQCLTDINIELTMKLKQTQIELKEQKTITETCETKLLDMIKDNKDISQQLETLKELWISTQDKLEKEEIKRQSLERINRQLSQSYKDDRLERSIDSVKLENPVLSYRDITPKTEMDL